MSRNAPGVPASIVTAVRILVRNRLGSVVTVVCTWGLAFLLTTCADGSGYQGVSADEPTGSRLIRTDQLVAAFDMSSTANDLLRDFSLAGNNGVIMGTTTVPTEFGEGLRFVSPSDRIDLPENKTLAIDGPLTILLWLRVDELGLHQHILACDDKFALWVTPANKIRFSDTLGHGMDTADEVEAGSWYAMAAVFDGTTGTEVTSESVRLYLNGVRVPTDVVNRSNDVPLLWAPGELYESDACYIGFESHQGNTVHQTLPFVGVIDELAIFRRALSDDEIRVHATRNGG